MSAPCYNVVVGAQTGLLKGIDIGKKVFRNLNGIKTLNRDEEICCMEWKDDGETEMLLATRNQTVKTYNLLKETFTGTFDVAGGEGSVRGLATVNNCLLTCVESGLLRLWPNDDEPQVDINVGSHIDRMRQNPEKHHLVATGGEENDLKIWDLNQPTNPLFKAKNVPHDFLNLRVPIWVKDMQFVPSSEQVIVCTGHHQVRLYDPSTPRRRPVIQMEFGEYPLTALALTAESQVIAGNARGYMALLDLRKKSVVHHYKGCAGGIRSVRCHPTLPIVASCGLDRFLRIHNITTHKLLNKVYLKSPLNCLLLRTDYLSEDILEPEPIKDNATIIDSADEKEDDVDLWANMEEVSNTSKRKQVFKDQKVKKRKTLKKYN